MNWKCMKVTADDKMIWSERRWSFHARRETFSHQTSEPNAAGSNQSLTFDLSRVTQASQNIALCELAADQYLRSDVTLIILLITFCVVKINSNKYQ